MIDLTVKLYLCTSLYECFHGKECINGYSIKGSQTEPSNFKVRSDFGIPVGLPLRWGGYLCVCVCVLFSLWGEEGGGCFPGTHLHFYP